MNGVVKIENVEYENIISNWVHLTIILDELVEPN